MKRRMLLPDIVFCVAPVSGQSPLSIIVLPRVPTFGMALFTIPLKHRC